jgi:hypothetical protein
MGGVGAGQGILQFLAQRQQASGERSLVRTMSSLERQRLSSFENQTRSKQIQINEAAALEAFQRQRQGLRETGALRARIAETGVLGNTPLRQLNRAAFGQEFDVGLIEANRQGRIAQTIADRDAFAREVSTNLAELNFRRSQISSPNPFLAGLQILSGGVSGFSTGEQLGIQLAKLR